MKSHSEVDYSQLRDFLTTFEWEKANEETKKVALLATNSDWSSQMLGNFPCEDLRIIDELWVKHSDGHFGFSVQKRIYESVYENLCERWGKTEKYGIRSFNEFGDRVGWRKREQWGYYYDLHYGLWAPAGHLPSFDIVFFESEFWASRLYGVAKSIFCSVESCGL